jgi:hypothetical protein
VIYTSSARGERSPVWEYFDLLDPPEDDEFLVVKGLRAWQRYFNDRFQTYGRFVHFYVYFDSGSGSPESRRADAADNYAQVKPFAVVTDVTHGGNEVDYVEAMARRGVLNFGTLTGKSQSFFRKLPKLIWGYDPSVEIQAEAFSTYVCQKVVGKPAVLAGPSASGNMQNRPRKLGLFHTTDEDHADRIRLAELVQKKVEACGGEIAATATFEECCYVNDTATNPDYAATNMADFSGKGITTILWPGGMEGYTANAAASQGYFPEWIVLGDDLLDGNEQNRRARTGSAFHRRSMLITPEVYAPPRQQQRCYQAFREADQALNPKDLQYVCGYYRNLFQLFTGIQVAGPRLGPTSVDKGYHAIPPVASKDNQSPACFYEPGDYTCVKDNQIQVWDDEAVSEDTRNGCWRILANGARYFRGQVLGRQHRFGDEPIGALQQLLGVGQPGGDWGSDVGARNFAHGITKFSPMSDTLPAVESDPSAATSSRSSSGSEWSRKYPPLITILVALVLAIAVLPSALNLPQTNPTQTLEYAPIPPEDNEEPPPVEGNLSSLGLGSSSGVAEDAIGGDGAGPTPPPLPGGKGVSPSNKRCVGNPPRQTEDPTSPPCVAFFDGDNFGATYQGVTEDEVRVLVYMSGGVRYINSSEKELAPTSEYFDLFEPPDPDEFVAVRGLRAWQRYFNDRFQTYGRAVHFFVYFDNASGSPEARRADAADNFAQVKPFAVVTDVSFGGNEVDYVEAMARRGVLNFGTLNGKAESFFRKFPKLIWGYDPTIEYQAKAFSSYVCQKVVGKPAVLAGNSRAGNMQGRPRKLGLLHTSDENHADRIRLAELVQQQVESCGGEIEALSNFTPCCFVRNNGGDPDKAATDMSDFSAKGITTILWPGGMDGWTANAAAGQGYFPEWIVLGDDLLDGNEQNRQARNGPAFHNRAILITPEVFAPARTQQRCFQAFREADQQMVGQDIAYVCDYYRNLFQLFTGIQVAGPRLGPSSVDKGYHAIPAVASKDNQSPSCFYDTGDYTCVKDNTIQVWDDQTAPPDENRNGCWRIIRNGARHFPGEYPEGNLDVDFAARGGCSSFSAGGNPARNL